MLTLLPPRSSLAAIAVLKRMEWTRTLLWGAARWLAVVAAVGIAAMAVDYRVDQFRDTPTALRVSLLLIQIAIAGYFAWHWIVQPLRHAPGDVEIASRIEADIPEYGHRLVTAIQLTRSDASRQGMSDELIHNLTREAEGITANRDLSGVVRGQRFENTMAVALIPLLLVGLFTAFMGAKMSGILLSRQFLADREIPHAVQLMNKTVELWPAGEEVTLTYEATGPLKPEHEGEVRVKVGNLGGDDYPLKFAGQEGGIFLFQATIPPGTQGFTHRAWLRGGRSRGYGEVRYEARPVVSRIDAWVRVPDFVGLKPDGTPYETYMPQQGEIACVGGSKVRIEIETSKAIREGRLHLLTSNEDKKEIRLKSLPLTISGADGNFATCLIPIPAEATGYELEVVDTFGFRNAVLPKRSIRILPDSPPQVDLLSERFAGQGDIVSAETEVDGMPLPLGKPMRIDYKCSSPLGLGRARLVYRVNEDPWNYLPLTEVKQIEETGPWDFTRQTFQNAAFQKAKLGDQVEFHAVPSAQLDLKPSRLEGVGSFTFQTKTLKKLKDGQPAELEVGDRVEVFVEVFDLNPATGREPGKSDARVKEIVTEERFLEWVLSTLQSESKLRDLEKRQRAVFGQDR